ncbi:MAG: phosphoribosyl-ATP diphosphatase [Candidatus Hodgkinia cicadicola]
MLISYSSKLDKIIHNQCFNISNHPRFEIKKLIYMICYNIQTLKSKSWSSKMLSSGLKYILKKIGEESTEFILSIIYENDNSVIMESADFIYHVLLLVRSLGLNYFVLFNFIKFKTCWLNEIYSLEMIEPLAVIKHNYIVNKRNNLLRKGIKIESSIYTMIENFNKSVSELIFLSTKLERSTYFNIESLYYITYDVLFNLMVLLCQRNLPYKYVSDEISFRMST